MSCWNMQQRKVRMERVLELQQALQRIQTEYLKQELKTLGDAPVTVEAQYTPNEEKHTDSLVLVINKEIQPPMDIHEMVMHEDGPLYDKLKAVIAGVVERHESRSLSDWLHVHEREKVPV